MDKKAVLSDRLFMLGRCGYTFRRHGIIILLMLITKTNIHKIFIIPAVVLAALASLASVVALTPPALAASFTITISNSPGGTVTGAGQTCTSATQYCHFSVDTASLPITLTATPDAGKVLSKWGASSDCTPSGNTCTVTSASASQQKWIYPYWEASSYTVSIQKQGTGSGTVKANTGAINCGSVCSAVYAAGTNITLTATPAAGSTFAGWQTTGTFCLTGGKGSVTGLTTATCTFRASNGKAVAKFNKVAVAATPTPSPIATATPKPAAVAAGPVFGALEVGGKKISTDGVIALKANESLTIKGTATPGAAIKLFIFSTPREATITADGQGNWQYLVTGLEPGAHRVEAEATDPATKKTSSRTTLVKFELAGAGATANRALTGLSIWAWAGGGALILLAGGLLWLRHRKTVV